MVKKHIQTLEKSPLFQGIHPNEIEKICLHFGFTIKDYKKDAFILQPGHTIDSCYLILQGTVQLYRIDLLGNRVIMYDSKEGGIFGEISVCSHRTLNVYVNAKSDCKIMELKMAKLTDPNTLWGGYYAKFLFNLMEVVSNKAINFFNKSVIFSKNSIRDRILDFLSFSLKDRESKIIKIQFNRDEMADYLSVNRSALSRELSKMQKEGILRFHKNTFEILSDTIIEDYD